MTITVEGVPAHHVEFLWPQVWPFIEKAIARFPTVAVPYTETEILTNLFLQKAQLWVAWDCAEERVIGAVLTSIASDERYSPESFVEAPLLGGEKFKEWRDQMWGLLKSWGICHGCSGMVGYGRKGWKRAMGFEEVGTNEDGIRLMYRPFTEN